MPLLNLADVDPIRCKEALTTKIDERGSGKTVARLIKLLERARVENAGKDYIFVCENSEMVHECLCLFEYWLLENFYYSLTIPISNHPSAMVRVCFPKPIRLGFIGTIKDWWSPPKQPKDITFKFISMTQHARVGSIVNAIFFDVSEEQQAANQNNMINLQITAREIIR